MKTKHLVLIGGGHAHALFLRDWKPSKHQGVQLTVIEPNKIVPYTGILPEFVAGNYTADDLYIDIEALTKKAGGEFVQAKALHIDPDKQIITTETSEIAYDVLSVDIGIHTRLDAIPGLSKVAVGVKPLGAFAAKWDALLQNKTTMPKQDIVIIGGGVAGVEVALSMRHRLQSSAAKDSSITIVDRGEPLGRVSKQTKKFLTKELQDNAVVVRGNEEIIKVTKSQVQLASGPIPASFVVAALGPSAYAWVSKTNLPTTNGYIDIDSTLRSPKYPNVFAVGDCAHFMPKPLLKAGVYAVREAPILLHNVEAYLANKELKTYKPQNDYLKIISLGKKQAAADKWGFCLHGAWAWQVKDRINMKFVDSLRE